MYPLKFALKITLIYMLQAGYGTFLATSLTLPLQTKGLTQAYVGLTGRKLLHV